MGDGLSERTPTIRFFPEERTSIDYPWMIWAVGWFAILKGLTWLALDPNIPDVLLKILGIKYLGFMFPYLICGIAVWNMKRWAVWIMLVLTLGELLFFILNPGLLASFAFKGPDWVSRVFGALVFMINGPLSNVLLLASVPVLLKLMTKKTDPAPGQEAG